MQSFFFLTHSYSFRCFVARYYPLSQDIILVFKDLLPSYWLQRNPNVDNALLKSLQLEFLDCSFLDDTYCPVLVSEFLKQGTSIIPYLDENLMSDELTTDMLIYLIEKGYKFQYLQLKPNHLKWSFEMYDYIYKYESNDFLHTQAFTTDFFENSYLYKSLFESYLNDNFIKEILQEKYHNELISNNLKYFTFEQNDIKFLKTNYLKRLKNIIPYFL